MLGPKLRAKRHDIDDVLADSKATFVLVICYTGKPDLAADVRQPLDQLLTELNDDGDLVSLQVLSQKALHDIVEQRALGESVDLTIMLHEWGMVREPYKSYYGQMNIADISAWAKWGDHLYHRNIRGFKGSTEVNNAIVDTIHEHPDSFLYFNNGITLLCTELEKKPLGGKSRSTAVFDCKGASVVNGAQTVGSVILASSTITPPNITDARVMVRLISLQGCPDDFGFNVTRATNTQNRIEKRDFAALDPEQSRLRSDLFLSYQKEYVFRSGDQPPTPEKGCTLDEATVALACAHPDLKYCMEAKREVSRLYEDIKEPPYTVLFNPSLTALKLWRAVEVLRKTDAFLRREQEASEGRPKLIAIHGNRLLLHFVFRRLSSNVFTAEDAADIVGQVERIAGKDFTRMKEYIQKNHPTAYPAQLFKNITKCKAIAASVLSEQQQ